MKKLLSPIIAIIISTAMLCACSANEFDWVVQIDNAPISPQLYIMAEMQAYIEAQLQTDMQRENPEIDGISAEQWVADRTLENLKTAHFIDKEFEERGLVIDSLREEYIRTLADSAWETVSDFYTNNGVTADYYKSYFMHLYKKQLIFNDIYLGEENQEEIEKRVDEYLNRNLSYISIFAIPTVNDDGSMIDKQQAETLQELALSSKERLDGGENINELAGDVLTQAARLLGSDEDFSNGEMFVETGYINAVTPTISDDMKNLIRAIQPCHAELFDGENCVYVVYKNKLYQNETEYQRLKAQVVSLIKDDEYNRWIKEQCEGLSVVCNDMAVKFYSPSKIVTKVTD